MKELLDKWLNKVVYVRLGGLKVKVVIVDVKKSYGKTRFLISPVEGKDATWVEDFIGYIPE